MKVGSIIALFFYTTGIFISCCCVLCRVEVEKRGGKKNWCACIYIFLCICTHAVVFDDSNWGERERKRDLYFLFVIIVL